MQADGVMNAFPLLLQGMFHGRDPYSDPERRMWRVWVWTSERRFRTLPINCTWYVH